MQLLCIIKSTDYFVNMIFNKHFCFTEWNERLLNLEVVVTLTNLYENYSENVWLLYDENCFLPYITVNDIKMSTY